MIKQLIGAAFAAALLTAPSFAQQTASFRETIPSAGNSGMVCDMTTENYDSSPDFTLIQGEPRIGGYSFGLSPFFIEPTGSDDYVTWTTGSGSNQVQHILQPSQYAGYTWENITANQTTGVVSYFAY